jgi:hypothetical protein
MYIKCIAKGSMKLSITFIATIKKHNNKQREKERERERERESERRGERKRVKVN